MLINSNYVTNYNNQIFYNECTIKKINKTNNYLFIPGNIPFTFDFESDNITVLSYITYKGSLYSGCIIRSIKYLSVPYTASYFYVYIKQGSSTVYCKLLFGYNYRVSLRDHKENPTIVDLLINKCFHIGHYLYIDFLDTINTIHFISKICLNRSILPEIVCSSEGYSILSNRYLMNYEEQYNLSNFLHLKKTYPLFLYYSSRARLTSMDYNCTENMLLCVDDSLDHYLYLCKLDNNGEIEEIYRYANNEKLNDKTICIKNCMFISNKECLLFCFYNNNVDNQKGKYTVSVQETMFTLSLNIKDGSIFKKVF